MAESYEYGRERFREEAKTLAKFIGNPNIAGVSSYFDENGTSYFVMDYIEGVSFKTYIANAGGKVSVDETLNVMVPVLKALIAVHEEGFIHRDVTPDNIFISKDGNVKLLDFGSARYSIGDKSKSLNVILKVVYAPKEQYIRRGRQGPYTDVYSCGACFYAAITGFLPPESLERSEQDTLVPISQCGIEIPEWLDNIILKALAVQPEDRFQNAAEFLNAIENQLMVAVPVSGAEASKKKPSPLAIGAIAAALVLAVGLGVFFGGRSGGGAAGGGTESSTPLKKAEVPSITIAGQEYSTDLRKLSLENQGLSNADLRDLRYMINLTTLTLNGNDISDISFVSALEDLESLNLRETYVTDLTPIAGLTKLKQLQFGGAYWEDNVDLGPLAGLTELTYLSLPARMGPTDLSPLSGLVNLTGFTFDGMGSSNGIVSDLGFLSGLTKLTDLWLPVRDLTSLKGLENLTELKELTISGTFQLDDIGPLAGLTKLTSLHFSTSGNSSTLSPADFSALSGLTEMKSLHLYGLETDASLDALSTLTALTELKISGKFGGDNLDYLAGMVDLSDLTVYDNDGMTVDDLSALQNLRSLKTLMLSSVSVRNSFTGLENLTELTEMSIYSAGSGECAVADTQPLRNLSNLKTLTMYLYNYGYSDGQAYPTCSLEGLSGLSSLKELQLSGVFDNYGTLGSLTALTKLVIHDTGNNNAGMADMDISGFEGLTSVTEMTLDSSRLTDLTPIGRMTALKTLELSAGNYQHPVSSIEPLTNLQSLTTATLNLNGISDYSSLSFIKSLTTY